MTSFIDLKWNAIYDAYNEELKSMFEKQARVERFDLIQTFHACKQEEGKPVADYVLKMKGYLDQLERLGKTIGKLHAMIIEYAKGLPKKAETPQVMMIKGGKIQKANKKSLKAKGKGKANGKGKDKQGFREARKLKQGALYLYVGNGFRAQIEAIGSFDLVFPNGLVICLDNCHYAPSITRGVVSVHRLVENGFVQCFMDFRILVSKNNVHYFNAIPSNGIYKSHMHDLVPNNNSIYNVSTKRAKHNLDSIYLWHCRLAHISKKLIEKLHEEGLLKSTDDESFDQCVSCLSGKMTRKSFPHCPERAQIS
ncbi:retrotransposon protein, putative, ty1-copia subclass [Tanacetum coccineum]